MKLKSRFRQAWKAAAAVGLVVGLGLGPSQHALGAEHPNIVFIFADDLSYEMLGALHHTEVQTPNLDRLASQGLAFTHAYNMGSWTGAVCIASRTMLNTGRFLWGAHRVYDTSEQERQAGRWWSEYLKQAGYATYFTGKWHVRAKAESAFEVVRHVRPGMPDQTPEGYNRPRVGQPDPWSPWDPRFGGYWKGGKHWSEVVADDAIDFLARATKDPRPFFMYLAFNASHDPRQSPKEYVERYPDMGVPKNFLPEYPYKDGIGCGPGLRDEQLAPFPRTEYAVEVNRREYAAITTHLDAQVGRILETLDRLPQATNTWVFFTADQGLAVGHHGLMGKQNQYDHSVRVPFLVRGPGVPVARRIDAPIYLQDVMPTTLELAGVARPAHVDFHSLLPFIQGETHLSAYPAVYGAYLDLQRMVTQDGYKLILYPAIKKARLYNLRRDPLEMVDLAEQPDRHGVMQKLFGALLQLQRETDDTLDLSALYPELR